MVKFIPEEGNIISFLTDSYSLNCALGGQGIETGQLVVLQSPTGDGKTTALQRLALKAADQGHKVAFVSLGEQSMKVLQAKLICMLIGIPYKGKKAARYTDAQLEMIKRTQEPDSPYQPILQNIDYSYGDGCSGEVNLLMHVRKLADEGYKFIFLDYLGNLIAKNNDNQYMFLATTANKLTQLAEEKDVTIITAMQTNREFSKAMREEDFDVTSVDENFMQDSIGVARKATICISWFTYKGSRYLNLYKNRDYSDKLTIKLNIKPKTYEWVELEVVGGF